MVSIASTGLLPMTAPMRSLRAGAFAMVSVVFALIAHSTTSHTLPTTWVVALSVAVVAASAHSMAGMEHRLPSLVAGLLATQLILHAVFQVQTTGQANATAAGWLCCGSDVRPATLSTTATTAHGGGPFDCAALVQLAVHVLAALVIATALRQRERTVWMLARQTAERAGASLGRLITALVFLVALAVPVVGGPLLRRAQPHREAPSAMRSVLLDARAPGRGPPTSPVTGRAVSFA